MFTARTRMLPDAEGSSFRGSPSAPEPRLKEGQKVNSGLPAIHAECAKTAMKPGISISVDVDRNQKILQDCHPNQPRGESLTRHAGKGVLLAAFRCGEIEIDVSSVHQRSASVHKHRIR